MNENETIKSEMLKKVNESLLKDVKIKKLELQIEDLKKHGVKP